MSHVGPARFGARGFAGLVLLAVVASVVPARAASIVEEFVFPDIAWPSGISAGSNYYVGSEIGFCGADPTRTDACQGAVVEILFDVANLGNAAQHLAFLSDDELNVGVGPLPLFPSLAPATDASGYVAGSPLPGALLTLTVRGLDGSDDNVLVEAFAADGGGVLFQNTLSGVLASTPIAIPLSGPTLAALVADGMFGIRVSSFFDGDFANNDFNLERARLEVVPEPAGLLLLGSGLLGMGAMAHRRRRRP